MSDANDWRWLFPQPLEIVLRRRAPQTFQPGLQQKAVSAPNTWKGIGPRRPAQATPEGQTIARSDSFRAAKLRWSWEGMRIWIDRFNSEITTETPGDRIQPRTAEEAMAVVVIKRLCRRDYGLDH